MMSWRYVGDWTMLTHNELVLLGELCMIEMALLATAKGIQNIDEVERFQLVKSAGMKIEQMLKDKE